MFCNIYLWFNLSATSFFLCVFVFHSVLLLVNSTLVIFVVPYKYSFCLLVKGINLLGWFPFAMRHQSFPWFAFDFSLSFFFPFFLSFFPSPAHSFLLKLLTTSQIKSLGFRPEFCFWKFILPSLSSWFSEAAISNHCPLRSFLCFFSCVFFFILKTRFSRFVFLGRGRSFWPILAIVILAFVNLDCFLICLFFLFTCLLPLWESLFVVLWTEHQNWKPFFNSCSLFWTKEIKFFWSRFRREEILLQKISLCLWSLFLYFYTLNLFVSFSVSCFCTFGLRLCPSLSHFAPLHFVHCSQWSFCCLFILLNLLVHLFVGFAPVLRCFW